MHRQRQRSASYRLIVFIAALSALYGGYYWGNQYKQEQPAYRLLRVLPSPRALTSLDLIDHSGQPFTEQSLVGYWNLVMFGYTGADSAGDDLLPLATRVLNRLADQPDLRTISRVLFVSLDPEQDLPEVLKQYLGHYGSDFVGVTGSIAEIGRFAGQVGVGFQRQPTQNAAGYRIDHGTSIAVVDPQGRMIGLFTGRVDAANIAADLKLIAGHRL